MQNIVNTYRVSQKKNTIYKVDMSKIRIQLNS